MQLARLVSRWPVLRQLKGDPLALRVREAVPDEIDPVGSGGRC
jgi:hypothetical protein